MTLCEAGPARSEVVLERVDGVATITLNRPERRNAMGRGFTGAMLAAPDEAEADPGVGALVLTGSGPTFCGGGDVNEIMSPHPTNPEAELLLIQGFNRVIGRLYYCPLPVIAAVNGPAVGGGTCLGMACDIALAGPRARYDFLFGRIGLSAADMAATQMLTRLVGAQRAAYLILGEGSLDAEKGVTWGVFAATFPESELLPAAWNMAVQMARRSRRATAISKLSLRRGQEMTLEAALGYEAYLQSFAFRSDEHKARLAAFIAQKSG
jgi:2-(1,2-epoxy-1,2-dihydrophenyl)acetyl-CoA isomerase